MRRPGHDLLARRPHRGAARSAGRQVPPHRVAVRIGGAKPVVHHPVLATDEGHRPRVGDLEMVVRDRADRQIKSVDRGVVGERGRHSRAGATTRRPWLPPGRADRRDGSEAVDVVETVDGHRGRGVRRRAPHEPPVHTDALPVGRPVDDECLAAVGQREAQGIGTAAVTGGIDGTDGTDVEQPPPLVFEGPVGAPTTPPHEIAATGEGGDGNGRHATRSAVGGDPFEVASPEHRRRQSQQWAAVAFDPVAERGHRSVGAMQVHGERARPRRAVAQPTGDRHPGGCRVRHRPDEHPHGVELVAARSRPVDAVVAQLGRCMVGQQP